MTKSDYNIIPADKGLIKAWTEGVPVEDEAIAQLRNTAAMPFIFKHLAVMPDVHWGMGSTVGSVIATRDAIIPAAVGVDIGCGMVALRTTLTANDLPESLKVLRAQIERDVPVGFNTHKDGDRQLHAPAPESVVKALEDRKGDWIGTAAKQMGTLGGGNHFIEVCLDEEGRVWVMLHSGSRGTGNKIGTYYINKAKELCEAWHIELPDNNLAYLPKHDPLFEQYVTAVHWAQEYAFANRAKMMELVIAAMRRHLPAFELTDEAINCHHNYISLENHFGENVYITRKGAVQAREGQLGIIPGSMGAKSYIVRGKGNHESFCSCSHGAGRKMSRTKAKGLFTLLDHAAATEGVECRKDADVLDETPAAYKDIDTVMAAQSSLVDVVATLKQVLCVKG